MGDAVHCAAARDVCVRHVRSDNRMTGVLDDALFGLLLSVNSHKRDVVTTWSQNVNGVSCTGIDRPMMKAQSHKKTHEQVVARPSGTLKARRREAIPVGAT